MAETELIKLSSQVGTQKSEVQVAEVKSAHGDCPEKLWDTISAFANKNSGEKLLSELDKGRRSGETQGWLDADEVFSELERVCHDEEILFGALLEDADAEAQ